MDSCTWCLPPASAVSAPVTVAYASGPLAVPVIEWATAGLPVVVPLSALPVSAQVSFATQEGLLPIDHRVAILLAADRRTEAFSLAVRVPRPLGAQGRLELELVAWSTLERTRLGLPATGGSVLVVGDDARGSLAGEVRGLLNEVMTVLAPLPWPRWAGPVVIYVDGIPRGIPANGVIRPALPLLNLEPGPHFRGEVAAHYARLALALSAPPPAGWPAWLTVGVGEAARATALGHGLSPRTMAARRAAAGVGGMNELLGATIPDPDLAKAVVVALLNPDKQANFSSLLDLLRQGASSLGALRVAYNLDLEGLSN